jgi:hypoxia induced protein
MVLTVAAFVGAYRARRRGDSQRVNIMFRYRVAAQGFTVLAMVAGSMYYNKDRETTKELRKLKEQRDNEEKRQRWIRELEARDEEEKAIRAEIHARKGKSDSAKAAAAAAKDAPAGEAKPGGVLEALNLSKGWGNQGEAPAADGKVDAKTADVKAAVAEAAPVKPAEPTK